MRATVNRRQVVVRFDLAGMHHWPEPTEARSYLGAPHRHRFGFVLGLDVDHDERAVEFHDLQLWGDTLMREFPPAAPGVLDFGSNSCEAIASLLLNSLATAWPRAGAGFVEVWEDGEVGARIEGTWTS